MKKLNLDDVDIAVFLTTDELNQFLIYQNDVWKVRSLRGLNRLRIENSKVRKHMKAILNAKNLGGIKPSWWKDVNGISINDKAGLPDTFNNVSHLFEGISTYDADKLNLSIIITDSKYDVSPYLKINEYD